MGAFRSVIPPDTITRPSGNRASAWAMRGVVMLAIAVKVFASGS